MDKFELGGNLFYIYLCLSSVSEVHFSDVMIAALLGADEFGMATAPLIVLGFVIKF
jgi:hypothetical protein